MPTIVALGEMLIDFAPVAADAAGYPTLKAQPGGAPCNFLAALQKYGCSTAMIGKVGDDRFGRLLVKTAADCGIETRGIIKDAAVFTTMAIVTLDAEGNREFSFARKPGADTCLTEHEADYSLIDTCRVFHFGTLSLTDEPARTATQKAVAYAKARGKLISFDPNLRPQLWPSQDVMVQTLNRLAAKADMVLPGTAEGKILMGSDDPKEINAFYLQNGAKAVVTKCGGDGAFVSTKDEEYMVPGFKVETVVDTVGAGDGFAAGVITALMEGLPLKESVRRGTAIGAIQVMSRGDNEGLPYPEQLKAFMER